MTTHNATTPFRRVRPNDYTSYLETHPSIPVGSSLSVIGGLLLIIRERFSPSSDTSIPWSWSADPLHPGQFLEDHGKSTITIEVAGHDDTIVKEKKPAILIDRSPIQTSAGIILNDTVIEHRPTGGTAHHGLVSGSFSFICKAYTKGTAEILANIIFEWLIYNRAGIRKLFQFHDFGPFVLGNEVASQKSSTVTQCTVEARISWEHRWSNVPLAPKLTSLVARIYGSTDPSTSGPITVNDTLLAKIASHSASLKLQ